MAPGRCCPCCTSAGRPTGIASCPISTSRGHGSTPRSSPRPARPRTSARRRRTAVAGSPAVPPPARPAEVVPRLSRAGVRRRCRGRPRLFRSRRRRSGRPGTSATRTARRSACRCTTTGSSPPARSATSSRSCSGCSPDRCPATVGRRAMFVGDAGSGLPEMTARPAGAVVDLEGAPSSGRAGTRGDPRTSQDGSFATCLAATPRFGRRAPGGRTSAGLPARARRCTGTGRPIATRSPARYPPRRGCAASTSTPGIVRRRPPGPGPCKPTRRRSCTAPGSSSARSRAPIAAVASCSWRGRRRPRCIAGTSPRCRRRDVVQTLGPAASRLRVSGGHAAGGSPSQRAPRRRPGGDVPQAHPADRPTRTGGPDATDRAHRHDGAAEQRGAASDDGQGRSRRRRSRRRDGPAHRRGPAAPSYLAPVVSSCPASSCPASPNWPPSGRGHRGSRP